MGVIFQLKMSNHKLFTRFNPPLANLYSSLGCFGKSHCAVVLLNIRVVQSTIKISFLRLVSLCSRLALYAVSLKQPLLITFRNLPEWQFRCLTFIFHIAYELEKFHKFIEHFL